MRKQLPKDWDEARIASVINHYESQTEDDAVREDDRAFANEETVVEVPLEILDDVRRLIAKAERKTATTVRESSKKYQK